MFIWRKRYRDEERAHHVVPFMLDAIKARLAFSPATPRRSDLPFFLCVAMQGVAAALLIPIGIIMVSSWTLGAAEYWFLIQYTERIRFGWILIVTGLALSASAGLLLYWRRRIDAAGNRK